MNEAECNCILMLTHQNQSTVFEMPLKILNSSIPVFHSQASLLGPVKMLHHIDVTSDGIALILTAIGDFKCAHTNRRQ